MSYTYSYYEISPNDLAAIDLCEERDAAYDRYSVDTDHDEAPIAAYKVNIDDQAEAAEVLTIDDRVGIAWGSYADWATYTDVAQAINDYFNDPDTYESRN